MQVQARLSQDGKVLNIAVIGNFVFGLLKDFREAYSNGDYTKSKIIVDLSATVSMDSSALGMLLALQEFLNKPDGEIHIININPELRKIFDISHFEQKFTLS